MPSGESGTHQPDQSSSKEFDVRTESTGSRTKHLLENPDQFDAFFALIVDRIETKDEADALNEMRRRKHMIDANQGKLLQFLRSLYPTENAITITYKLQFLVSYLRASIGIDTITLLDVLINLDKINH